MAKGDVKVVAVVVFGTYGTVPHGVLAVALASTGVDSNPLDSSCLICAAGASVDRKLKRKDRPAAFIVLDRIDPLANKTMGRC